MPDVVVVGGGIVGSSVAYNAARAGLRVTVVDRGDEGHATAAGAGIVAPGVGYQEGDAHTALVEQAAAYYPRLIAQLAEDGEEQTGYARVGAVLIATNAAEADYLREAKRFAEAGRAAGVQGIDELSLLNGAQARELFPALGDVPAALHLAGTARIDGRLMRTALRQAAVRRGVTLLHGEAMLKRENGVAEVLVEGQRLPAGAVVIAGGAWSAALGRELGFSLPVYPQRGQIAHLGMPGTETSQWPVVLTFQGHYLLTFPHDRVVAGATRENDAGFDYRLTAGGVYQVLGQALRIAPGLGRGTLREVRIGFRPATPDGLPILGRVAGLENVYVATGHGPTGLTMGPHAGAVIVDLILGQGVGFDLRPYGVERFEG